MDLLDVNGKVLFTAEATTLRELVEAAVRARVSLRGADLDSAYLYGANLRGADLQGADLQGADVRGACLRGANLRGAVLDGLMLGWTSDCLLSEILWRAAGEDLERQQFAAWVGRRTDLCWNFWRSFEHPCREWAIDELCKWVKDGDDAPEWLRVTEAKEE